MSSLVCLLLLHSLGCAQHPKLDVVPRLVDDGHVSFDLSATGIREVYSFGVEDTFGNPIWEVDLHQKFNTKTIEYGVLPAGGRLAASQIFPPENKAPIEIRGKTVVVSVYYQYDAYAPSTGTYEKTIQIP
jgi:hypothetical protein